MSKIKQQPTKRSRSPAESEGARSGSAPKKSSPKTRSAAKPTVWDAVEYQPRRRWWWYLIVGYIAVALAGLAFATGTWSVSLVIIAATIALFRWNIPKPRSWTYTLTGHDLHVLGKHVDMTLDLREYHSLYRDTYGAGQIWPYARVVLLPNGRFKPELDIYLPEHNPEQKLNLQGVAFDALSAVVPHDQALSANPPQRALRSLVRWFKLG